MMIKTLALAIVLFMPVQVFAKPALQTLAIEKENKVIHRFQVEIAEDNEARAQGLMYRKTLADNRGMLFRFENSDVMYFWMKNTFISLDMIFIDAQGVIRKIHADATPKDLTQISSDVPVKEVLEVKGGTAQKLGIKPGDKIIHEKPAKTVAKP